VAKRVHYHDIDSARSVLMFVSVALHAATVYAVTRPNITNNTDRHPFFDWLMNAFHLFITPTFFFVGGFFTVIMLRRKSVGAFMRERLIRTGVPLATTALTLNVVENYLRWRDAGGRLGFVDFLFSPAHAEIWASANWQLHLWFLVCLIPFFLLSGLVHAALPMTSPLRRWAVAGSEAIGRWAARPIAGVLFLLALAAVCVANFAVLAAVPGTYDVVVPGIIPLYRMFSEFPFFILGIMAAIAPTLLAAVWRWRVWMPFLALAMFIWAPIPSHADGRSEAYQLFILFANQLAIWTLVFFVLQFFHRFYSESSPARGWLADAALSMYLVHHSLVYVFGTLFVPVGWPPAVEFALVGLLAAGTVLAFHEYGIRRVPLLRLLFNGKTDLGRRSGTAPAAVPAE
jgi:glucans biosynthesis protein C